jgi:hypothetical protein
LNAYFEILKCEQACETTHVPKPRTNNSATSGRFNKRDRCRCPAGQYATWRFTSIEKGNAIRKYWPSACPKRSLHTACTTSD